MRKVLRPRSIVNENRIYERLGGCVRNSWMLALLYVRKDRLDLIGYQPTVWVPLLPAVLLPVGEFLRCSDRFKRKIYIHLKFWYDTRQAISYGLSCAIILTVPVWLCSKLMMNFEHSMILQDCLECIGIENYI